ncbi:MAG: sugar phosphate isomerase/epimerase family protein [bacterium]
MIACLNTVTTGRPDSLESFLDVAAGCGFGGVDYSIEPVARMIEERSLDAARELFWGRGVNLASIGLPVEFRGDERAFGESLKNLDKLASAAEVVGCTRCCTWLPPSIDESPAEFACRLVRRFRECAKVLGNHGIRLGIEWVGPATLRTKKHDFIHTMDGALELCRAIGETNVGLLFDSFHWFTAEHTISDIDDLPLSKIVHVHINDAPNKPVSEQLDNQRLLPGEGIIDLVGMLRALKRKGYTGYLSIETFGQELPKLGVEEAARRAKIALDSVLKSAGII